MGEYEFKLNLIYEGVRISENAKKMLNNGNYINADYITTSGIIINYNGMYVNVMENNNSNCSLDYYDNKFVIEW